MDLSSFTASRRWLPSTDPSYREVNRSRTTIPVDAAPDSALLDAGPDRNDSGKLSFGATCLADGDCDSNVCAPNDTGGPMWCSFRCTKTTQAEKCPVPPTPGTCNTHGYRRNQ